MKPRTIPTAEAWAELARHARTLAGQTPALVATLGRIVDTCRTHDSAPDSYPDHTPGADPLTTTSGGRGPNPDDDGEGPVTLTVVERAVIHRLSPHAGADQLDRLTIAACAELEAAVARLSGVAKLIADIGALRAARDPWEGRATACALMAAVGHYEPALVGTTTLGDLLDDETAVGRWCYDFARRFGRIPTEDERRARAEGRRVIVRDELLDRWAKHS